MKNIFLIIGISLFFNNSLYAQSDDWSPKDYNLVTPAREDGRFLSSYGVAHVMPRNIRPCYASHDDFSPKQSRKWQKGFRHTMEKITRFPQTKNSPTPVCIKRERRESYRLKEWKFYPLPECVSTFLALIPDDINKPVSVILRIPGSGGNEEGLAGESGITPQLNDRYRDPKLTQALNFVKEGYIAVAVDNPAAGEVSDLERHTLGSNYDYDVVSRHLLELGWDYLGYASYLDMQVLNQMKTQDHIRKDCIVVSGFSLGTKPMMVLDTLDTLIYAFVYNDFLCQIQERVEVITMPDKNERHPFPNSIRYLIPDFRKNFNPPDIVVALASRSIILTEEGLDRDLNLVRRAYAIVGTPDNMKVYHYKKFVGPNTRRSVKHLLEGLNRNEYFQIVNVDGPNHHFKSGLVVPWLKESLEGG